MDEARLDGKRARTGGAAGSPELGVRPGPDRVRHLADPCRPQETAPSILSPGAGT